MAKVRKIGRLILMLTSALIVAFVLLPIAFVLFFNPNDYKPQISQYLSDKTGLFVELKGDISLSLFPWVGLNAHHLKIAQPSGFGSAPLLQANEVALTIPLKSLLKSRLKVEGLIIKNAELQLIRQSTGETNWAGLVASRSSPSTRPSDNAPHATSSATPTSSQASSSRLRLSLDVFQLNNATVIFQDRQAGSVAKITQLNIKGKLTEEYSLPLKGDFQFASHNDQHPIYNVNAKATLLGTVHLMPNTPPRFDFLTTANMHFPKQSPQWENVTCSTKIQANVNKGVSFSDVECQAMHVTLTGKGFIPISKIKPITLDAHLNALNTNDLPQTVSKTSKKSKTSNATQPLVKNQSPSQEAPSSVPNALPHSRPIQANLSIDRLQVDDLQLSAVSAKLKVDNQQWRLTPLKATLYEGKLNATLSGRTQAHAPVILEGKVSDLQLNLLLNDLKQKALLQGKTHVDFSLRYAAKAISGTAKLAIHDGALNKIDIPFYLTTAQNLLKKEQKKATDHKKTPFSQLNSTLLIHDNRIETSDFRVVSPEFTANGEGQLNLSNDAIFFKVKAFKQYHDGKSHPNSLPLALRIKGTVQHPVVEPDLDVYLKTAAKHQLDKQIDKQIEKQLSKVLKKDPSANADESKKDLHDKIEKEVSKGLKKLFKF